MACSLAGKRLKVFTVCKNFTQWGPQMQNRRDRRRKGAGKRSGHSEYKEQSPGCEPEPASKRVLTSMCVRAHMCWGARWVSRMFWDQLHLCHLFGEEASAGRAGVRSNLLHYAAIPLSPCRLRCQLFACLSWWNSFKLKQWNEAQVPKCTVPLLHQHSSEESN